MVYFKSAKKNLVLWTYSSGQQEGKMRQNKSFLLVVLLVALVLTSCTQAKSPTSGSFVVITSPSSGTSISTNDTVDINVKASCSGGVERVELWVNGAMSGRANAPQGKFPKLLPVTFKWTPTVAGTYSLEARAYCHAGPQPQPFIVAVIVSPKASINPSPTAAVLPSPTPPPAPTNTPIPPTPKPTKAVATPTPQRPSLVAVTNLNVRTGPGTMYPKIGVLPKGGSAPITGKDASGAWWQIEFPPGTGRHGWVAAAYASAQSANGVPVVQAPPIPTHAPPTATNTPAATATPSPAPTATPAPSGGTFQVNFWADKTTINSGECTTLHWDVEGVQAVYLDGAGVTGHGSKQVCPPSTTTYTLHVVKMDGSATDRQVTIAVNAIGIIPTLPVVTLEMPDLTVENFSTSSPHCNKNFLVEIKVKNIGNASAGSFKVKYYLNNSLKKTFTVNTLGVGQVWTASYWFVFHCSSITPTKQKVIVDPDGAIFESNENNNEKTITVTFYP